MKALRGIRRGEAVLGSIVLAGLIGAAVLSSNGGEAATDTFASGDFRTGGYAAFFMLLQREGVAAQTFERRPAELADAGIDTLIVAYPAAGAETASRLAPDRVALRHWVASGGRLIALGTTDPFAAIEPPNTAIAPSEHVDTRVPHVTRSGRGELVLIPDARRFDNANLALGDNARTAYALAQLRRPGGAVAFDETIHGSLVDRRWWQTLDAAQLVALGGGMLAILIALIGGALRLGPAVALGAAREPASDEFVAAVAALYQRSKARRAAIGLLAHGARNATSDAATQLRSFAEYTTPSDRDLIASARLARTIREGS